MDITSNPETDPRMENPNLLARSASLLEHSKLYKSTTASGGCSCRGIYECNAMRMRVARWPGEESKGDLEVKRKILIVKTPLNPSFEALVQKCD